MTYNGINILEYITNKSHPALQSEAGDADVQTGALYQQFSAAKAWGWDTYWGVSRDNRNAMTGQHIIENALRLMMAHDEREKAKRKAKQK